MTNYEEIVRVSEKLKDAFDDLQAATKKVQMAEDTVVNLRNHRQQMQNRVNAAKAELDAVLASG